MEESLPAWFVVNKSILNLEVRLAVSAKRFLYDLLDYRLGKYMKIISFMISFLTARFVIQGFSGAPR